MQSYGAWVCAAFIGLIISALVPSRLDTGPWAAVISLSTIVLIENILMFEHSITYTFDRLKWGFLLSFLVGLSVWKVATLRPNIAIFGLSLLAVGACWMSIIQYLGIYVRYW
jgi:hypothetical protein